MTRKSIKVERRKGWVVSNLMQPIAGNRGGESRRWYQEQVMHAGEQHRGVIRNAGEIVLVK